MSFEEILRDAEIRSVEGDLRRARWPIRDSDPGQRGERQHPGTELPIFRAGLFRPDAYHSDNYGYWSDDDYRLRVGIKDRLGSRLITSQAARDATGIPFATHRSYGAAPGGTWAWPLQVVVADADLRETLIESYWQGRLFDVVVPLRTDRTTCDVLIGDDTSILGSAPKVSATVVIASAHRFIEDQAVGSDLIETAFHQINASALILATGATYDLFDGLIRELAHDNPLDVALAVCSPESGLIADSRFLRETSLRVLVRRWAARKTGIDPDGRLTVPDAGSDIRYRWKPGTSVRVEDFLANLSEIAIYEPFAHESDAALLVANGWRALDATGLFVPREYDVPPDRSSASADRGTSAEAYEADDGSDGYDGGTFAEAYEADDGYDGGTFAEAYDAGPAATREDVAAPTEAEHPRRSSGRALNVAVLDGWADGSVELGRPQLGVDCQQSIRWRISRPRANTAALASGFISPDRHNAVPLELHLAITSGGSVEGKDREYLVVAPEDYYEGDDGRFVDFRIRTGGEQQLFVGSLSVYFQKRTIEEVRIEGVCSATPTSGTELILTSVLSSLPGDTDRRTGDVIELKVSGSNLLVDPSKVPNRDPLSMEPFLSVSKKLCDEASKVLGSSTAPESEGEEKWVKALRSLAQHGRALYQQLNIDGRLKAGASLRVIVDPSTAIAVPLELAYRWPSPNKDARLCGAWKTSPDGRSCPAGEHNTDTVCPLGFLGLTTDIERAVSNGGTLPVGPMEGLLPAVLFDIRKILVATADRAKNSAAGVLATLGEAVGADAVTRAIDWEDWKHHIADGPDLLVAIVHNDEENGLVIVEPDDGERYGYPLPFSEIQEGYVIAKGSPKRPFVVLLTCEGARPADFGGALGGFLRAKASIVLVPLTAIRGIHAAGINSKLIELLVETASGRPSKPLNELLPELRRRCVSAGLLSGLLLLSVGAAATTLQLPARVKNPVVPGQAAGRDS